MKWTNLNQLISLLLLLLGSALVAAGLNLFLIPHALLSGGASGVAMIIGYVTGWNIALLYFAVNLPILIWGWFVIGKRFIFLSIISVLVTTWLLEWIPIDSVADDPLIGAVFGGVLIGIGSGLCLRVGGSTGGIDIIGSIVTQKHDFPLGTMLFILNGLIVLSLGYIENWDLALTSMLSIYVTGRIVDMIHVRHIKVTAFIVTNTPDQLLEHLLQRPRGVTVVKTRGAFTHKERDMLITVTTRYELAELKKTIREVDPNAFVNIVETVEIMGEFYRGKR